MRKIQKILVFLAIAVFGGALMTAPAFAIQNTTSQDLCSGISDSALRSAAGCDESSDRTVGSVATKIVNVMLWIAGLLAVVMIIVSGIKMITSAGDAGAVQKARMTLIYAVVGLIVAVLAYAIVNFVIGKVSQ